MKHAFLIMAHGNWTLLERLLRKLDHPDNDIFLHVDKKSDFPDAVQVRLKQALLSSELYLTKRLRINWGGYSQVECEMRLFEAAYSKRKYRYYHVMSGVDFPIKSMSYIHRFFEENDGFQFVDDEQDEWTERTVWQFRYYHPLQEFVGRKNSRRYPSFFVEYYLLKIQEALKIDRRKQYPDIHFKRAPNWVSVSDEFVCFLLSKEEWIKHVFANTKCSDEMIVPTVLFNSHFVDKQRPCMRYIDWSRGLPYTFTIDEFDELINCTDLFVRKVGEATEKQKLLLCELEKL